MVRYVAPPPPPARLAPRRRKHAAALALALALLALPAAGLGADPPAATRWPAIRVSAFPAADPPGLGPGWASCRLDAANGVSLAFRLRAPARPTRLVVFLDGSLSAGFDNQGQMGQLGLLRRLAADPRALVLVPQLPPDRLWDALDWTAGDPPPRAGPDAAPALKALAALCADLAIRHGIPRRGRTLVGFSLGATGALDCAYRYPALFGLVLAYAGASDPRALAADPDGPRVVLAHGTADAAVPPAYSLRNYAALRRAGRDAELRLVPGAGHDLEALAFSPAVRGSAGSPAGPAGGKPARGGLPGAGAAPAGPESPGAPLDNPTRQP